MTTSRLAAVVLAALLSSGCTVVKPIVGLVMGPVVLVEEARTPSEYHPDGEHPVTVGFTAFFGIFAGAISGAWTGIISDWNVISGNAIEATRNFDDPFRTNAEEHRHENDTGDRREPTSTNPPGFGRG